MKNRSTKWTWDDEVWSEYDPRERAPWLIETDICNPVLSGVIKCRSKEDALLIAAAPELLEALEITQSLLELLGFQSSDEYQANAYAIAKAKGESNDL